MDISRVFVCLCWLIVLGLSKAQQLLQSLNGVVGAGNFSYYKLSRSGNLLLTLESVSGDVDLYVSDEIPQPEIPQPTIDLYTFKSDSCGMDMIEVSEKLNRPITIGVYGHPSNEISKFVLSISVLADPEELEYEQFVEIYYNYDDMFAQHHGTEQKRKSTSQSSSSASTPLDSGSDDDEGSIVWQIIITLLKVVFEMLL